MKIKLIKIIGVMGVIWVMGVNPSFAFDRDTAVTGARSIVNSNYTYNVVTNVVNAEPVQMGSNNHSLPAYQSVAKITAQLQQLKEKMKKFYPK